MVPGAGGKRKRGDGQYSYDNREENSRPSPHRPGNLSLAQHNSYQHSPQQQNSPRGQYDYRGGGRRRGSRGGRGGGNQRSPMNSPVTTASPRRASETSQPIPPATPVVQAQPPVEATPMIQNPPTPVKKATPTQTVEQKPREPMVYFYEYATDDQCSVWADSGRQEVLLAGREACKNKDRTTLNLLYQDLLRAGLDGRIEAADAGLVVKEILESVSPEDIVERSIARWKPDEIFLDILSICAEAWSESTSLKPIVFATGISAQLMRLILDSSLLESLGLIRSTFVRVGIRQQTNLLYRQSNYNLLREETEGYSKLVTELFTTSSGESLSSEVVEETFERVKGMIGAFDLDVGRVLDVTLDVFAAVLVKQYRFFVKYLRTSSWWPQDQSSEDRSIYGLGTLPKWALPGAAGRPMNDGERAAMTLARDARDRKFWERAKDIGMKAFFEIGNRRAGAAELKDASENVAVTNPTEADEDQIWMDVTGTLPPVGNKVAAQILGFKLRFYSSSARDASDVLPVNIIYLAALLIKVGFISLRDLYPHLWPPEDAMNDVKEAKLKENAEKERLSRPAGSVNALSSAKALTDDYTDPRKAREAAKRREIEAQAATAAKAEARSKVETGGAPPEDVDELPEPAEQKVQLLKSLLCIGAIPESLYMLGRFPWLLDTFTELPEHLHRILHHSLNKVYEPLRPLKEHPNLREQAKILDGDQSSVTKGQIRLVDAPPRKIMRWAQLDKDDTNEGIDYKFYWDDWADSIPVCQTVDDVFLLCSSLVNLSGVKIGQDSTLLVKLCRIGRYSLETDPSEGNKTRWIDLTKRLLLPALSLTKSNPGVANEMFELIKGWPTHTRYSLYAEWYQGPTSRLPDIKAALERTRAETKDVLKRISKSNLKTMARALAKIAYSSPGAVFLLAINQIEFYDNFSETFTECARYLTYLAYDAFNWTLLSSVGGGGKSRVQADGMLTSHWLQSLAVLISKVYKRYSVMSPVPMLQYVLDQLTRGNSVDLIVIEELVATMAGIVSDTNFNDAQVEAMGGGELLQARTMLLLLDRRLESKSTAKRLMRTLAEPKLAGQLLVAIAQERESSVYKLPDKDAPAKLLGNLFDEVHRVLAQYLDFMRTTLPVAEFNALVPNVCSLITEYGVEPGIAFWISRASISAAMSEYDAAHPKVAAQSRPSPTTERPEAETLKSTSSEVDRTQVSENQESLPEPAAEVEGEASTRSTNPTTSQVGNGGPEVEMQDADQPDSNPADPPSAQIPTSTKQNWHPVIKEIMDQLTGALPNDQWRDLSPWFYVTFWQNGLRDLNVPQFAYEDERTRVGKQLDTVKTDRSDISQAGKDRKDREKKILNDLRDDLHKEHKEHLQACMATRTRLGKEKNNWFSVQGNRWDEMNTALIEKCFFPRIRISSCDALYAFKMLKFLHSSGAQNFRTVMFLDQFFKEKRLESMFFLCSAKEAENLGRFLNELLADLGRWHANKSLYESQAHGTKDKPIRGFRIKNYSEDSSAGYMDYEDFRRVLFKWHGHLHRALKTCFTSGEYMHIRNAINILKAIVEHFPAINFIGNAQKECLQNLLKTEQKRPDLHLAAASLLGNVGRRESKWILPQAFHLVSLEISESDLTPSHQTQMSNDHGSNGAASTRSSSAKVPTPQPDAQMSKPLNPKASTFEPSMNAAESKASTSSKPGEPESEDGEIEDAKMTDANGDASKAELTGSDGAKDSMAIPASSGSGKSFETPQKPDVQQTPVPANEVALKPTTPQPPPTQGTPSAPIERASSSTTNGQAPIPARPEVSQVAYSPSVNGRHPHSLPDRPEGPPSRPGPARMPDRLGDGPLRDFGRDQRPPHATAFENRNRMPDRDNARHPVGAQETHARSYMSHRDRIDQQAPPRQEGDGRRGGPMRPDDRPRDILQQQEEQYAGQRPGGESKPRVLDAGENKMPPPSSNIPAHPDRAALIHGSHGPDRPLPSQSRDRYNEHSRREDYPPSGRSSRGASPTRLDDRRPLRNEHRQDLRHDDRSHGVDRRNVSGSSHPHPSRYDEGYAPAGPRTDRTGNFGPSGLGDRREWGKPPASVKPPIDPNHGRLNQDASYGGSQSEQYGRLNPTSDAPSGPRMANGNLPSNRNIRNVSAPQPQANTRPVQSSVQAMPPQSPTQDRPTPKGPSSYRDPSRQDSSRHASWNRSDAGKEDAAAPNSAAEAQDTAGIHPDRLKALHGIGSPQASQNPNSIQLQGSMGRPPPPARPQPPTVTVPKGPSNQQTPPSPVGPLPTANRGPPAGPSRSDRRFTAIQGVLQQNNAPNGLDRAGQGASIRGRGGRQDVNANPHSSSINSVAVDPFPAVNQELDRMQQRKDKMDLFADRRSASGPSTPQRHTGDENGPMYERNGRRGTEAVPNGGGREPVRDSGREGLRGGGPPLRDSGDYPRDSDRHPGRHHHRSRSQSRDQGVPPPSSTHRDDYDNRLPPARRDDGMGRDLRSRVGPAHTDDVMNSRDSGRRPPRSEVDRDMRRGEARGPMGDPRDMSGDWSRGERETRDMRDRRDGGGSGRKRGRGMEDGAGQLGGSAEKRPRRGL